MYTSQLEKSTLRNTIIELVSSDPQFIHCMELLIQLQLDNHIHDALWPDEDYIQNIDNTIRTHYHAQPLSYLWSKTRTMLQALSHYQQFCILYYLLDMNKEELASTWKAVENARKKGLEWADD